VSEGTENDDARLRHLLAVVERNRDARCTALLEDARSQARQLITTAWQDARARLHNRILATREQARQHLGAAEAREHTRLRLARHDADRALLARAWEPLGEELRHRWQQDSGRQPWIDGLVGQAADALTETNWRIEHPPDWPESERNELQARLAAEPGLVPEFRADPEITAGLRIRAATTCVDGTVEGLLRGRTRIEALILATLNECRSLLSGNARGNPEGEGSGT
jgi:hypothetical protein